MSRRSSFLPVFGVGLLLALYWAMAVSVSPQVGITADEPGHLAAGYSYWRFNDYRLNPENGTLPMRLAALPSLGLPVDFPSLKGSGWLQSSAIAVSDELFFGRANPVDDMVRQGRAAIAAMGVFALWLIWRWARGLFGRAAGWLALGLAVFCPALLAHGGLATSDMTVTACFLAALSAVWWLLHRVTWLRLILAAAACGLLFTAKMSGVLIVPLAAALLVLRWLNRAPLVIALGPRVKWLRRPAAVRGATLASLVAVAAGSLVVLWGSYGFRYEGFNRAVSQANGYYFSWEVVLERQPIPWSDPSSLASFVPSHAEPRPTALTRLVEWTRDRRLLPEAFLWGLAHTLKFSRERPAFFRGEHAKTGWAAYFPTAFWMKTPVPALAALLIGLGALAWRTWRARPGGRHFRWVYRAAPLLLFALVYWVLAINMNLNIGHRHILPTYPVVYILASAAVLWIGPLKRAAVAAVLVTLVALQAAESLAARPFYLAYFQSILGGSKEAYRTFVDSSLDWGQGLPELGAWQRARRAAGDRAPFYLSYAGVDMPRRYRIEATRFGDAPYDLEPRAFPARLRGGWYAIGATSFQRVHLPVRGDWTQAHEDKYQEMARRLRSPIGPTPEEHARAVQDRSDYEMLQFGRLCHYLKPRRPDAMVGASILMFYLSDADVSIALYAPLSVARRAGQMEAR